MRMLSLFLLFFGIFSLSCEKDKLSNGSDGQWKVVKIDLEGHLKEVSPPADATYASISIKIPFLDENPSQSTGYISGNTFRNTIGAHFESKKENEIKFNNYGGTRAAEDEWGLRFREHLLNTKKYSFKGVELTFFNKKNQPVIILHKQ